MGCFRRELPTGGLSAVGGDTNVLAGIAYIRWWLEILRGLRDPLVVLIPLAYREDDLIPLGRRGEAPLEQGSGIPIILFRSYPGGNGFEALP